MNFTNQINDLKAKVDNLNVKLETMDNDASILRGENGRLKRTYNALLENDVSLKDFVVNNTGYSRLSGVLDEVINEKIEAIAALEDDIANTKAQVKKLNKAIETLTELAGDTDDAVDTGDNT